MITTTTKTAQTLTTAEMQDLDVAVARAMIRRGMIAVTKIDTLGTPNQTFVSGGLIRDGGVGKAYANFQAISDANILRMIEDGAELYHADFALDRVKIAQGWLARQDARANAAE